MTRERGAHGKPRAPRSRVSGLLVHVVDDVDRRFLRGGPAAIDTRVAGDLVFLKVDERVGNVIPVFVREGAIIPRGDVLRANNDWTPNWAARLRVEVYPAEAAPS